MAFWLTTERAQEGPVFCSKGLLSGQRTRHFRPNNTCLDEFNGLGVFIDTYVLLRSDASCDAQKVGSYSNGKHSYAFPRVMAMLGDGKTKYDQANDGDVNSIAACSVWPEFMTCVLAIYAMYHRPEFVRPTLQPNYE